MIVFDLQCGNGHRFEGWFGSSTDFADQQARGLLACPTCDDLEIAKAPMAPAIGAKGNSAPHNVEDRRKGDETDQPTSPDVSNQPIPAELKEAFRKIAKAQARALKTSSWVGDKFADEARSMHYGEKVEKPIHGCASPKEARDLMEEGVTVAPLLIPIAPPDELN